MAAPHMDNLGYLLYMTQRVVYYGLTQTLRQACVDHGKPYVITPQQWGVLGTLAETDGLPAGKLGQRLASDAPTTTGVISRLEHSGLVRRRHDETDRRVVKVHLTDEGRAAMAFLPQTVEDYQRHILEGLSAADQRRLSADLRHLIANVLGVLASETAAVPPWGLTEWDVQVASTNTQRGDD